MISYHEEWIMEATELARLKRYDDARALALRVIRQDGRNISALWLVACVTNSLNERRNALRALLRVEPSNLSARQMLTTTEKELQILSSSGTNISSNRTKTSNVIRSIKPE